MGRKKEQPQAGRDTRAIDVDSLSPELRTLARDLDFKDRVSLNKLTRGREHERRGVIISFGIAAVLGIATICFVAFGKSPLASVFAGLWAVVCFAFANRSRHRLSGFKKLEDELKTRL